jgi:hypothetical protein
MENGCKCPTKSDELIIKYAKEDFGPAPDGTQRFEFYVGGTGSNDFTDRVVSCGQFKSRRHNIFHSRSQAEPGNEIEKEPSAIFPQDIRHFNWRLL